MFRLAHATQTAATVWCRHTANGALTLAVNGQTFTGTTIDTAVADGTGTVTATGLAAGSEYPFILSVGDTEVHTGTLRTMPESGEEFSLLWAYCWHTYRPAFAIQQALNRYGTPAAFFMAGDNIYSDVDTSTATRTIYGETLQNIGAIMQADPNDTAAAEAGLRAMYRARFKDPPTKLAIESAPTYPLVSDHDMNTGDNWDADQLLANANSYIAWASTQAQAIAVGEVHNDVFREFYAGTPDDAAWYYDFVIGDAHVFILDANHYRHRATEIVYGATQVAWLKASLSASTATWKIIATGEGLTEFSDSASLSVESQDLLNYITEEGITGCLSISGDIHAPYYGEYGYPQVRGGQVSQTNHTNIPDGYPGGTRYKWLGYYSNGVDGNTSPNAVTLLHVTPDRLTVEYLSDDGDVFFRKSMGPTDTTLSADAGRY